MLVLEEEGLFGSLKMFFSKIDGSGFGMSPICTSNLREK
jgi:hypothetical protein